LPPIAAVLIRRDQIVSAPAQRDDHDHALHLWSGFFGLPDPSPFVMKAEVLLRIAGLPYRVDGKGFSKAPKGKLPNIDDDGERIADFTVIRWHLEKMHKVDFERGLSEEQRIISIGRSWTRAG
jgi:hypothetical protein